MVICFYFQVTEWENGLLEVNNPLFCKEITSFKFFQICHPYVQLCSWRDIFLPHNVAYWFGYSGRKQLHSPSQRCSLQDSPNFQNVFRSHHLLFPCLAFSDQWGFWDLILRHFLSCTGFYAMWDPKSTIPRANFPFGLWRGSFAMILSTILERPFLAVLLHTIYRAKIEWSSRFLL